MHHLSANTFWESLPIDINDIDRIEVVRGTSAPLFGANAVTGVIHFITRKRDNSKEREVISNLQYGSYNTIIANTSLSFRVNKLLDIYLSGNLQQRDRTDEQYFDRSTLAGYVDLEALDFGFFGSPDDFFPHPEDALSKYGANAFIDFHPDNQVNFQLHKHDTLPLKTLQEQSNFTLFILTLF